MLTYICFISCVLKILSFKDCLVYQNFFLQISKSQLGYVSYTFLNFFAFWTLCFLKVCSMFLKIRKTCTCFFKRKPFFLSEPQRALGKISIFKNLKKMSRKPPASNTGIWGWRFSWHFLKVFVFLSLIFL